LIFYWGQGNLVATSFLLAQIPHYTCRAKGYFSPSPLKDLQFFDNVSNLLSSPVPAASELANPQHVLITSKKK
jgi:hypothetical protein